MQFKFFRPTMKETIVRIIGKIDEYANGPDVPLVVKLSLDPDL